MYLNKYSNKRSVCKEKRPCTCTVVNSTVTEFGIWNTGYGKLSSEKHLN